MARRPMITYPTRRLLGVIDDPTEAREALATLAAGGVPPVDIVLLEGAEGRELLGRLGPRPNLLSRLVRAFQFMSMDQLPDFLVYGRARTAAPSWRSTCRIGSRCCGREPCSSASTPTSSTTSAGSRRRS